MPIKPKVRAGAAHLWFFNTPITGFSDYKAALDTTTDDYLALPQIDASANGGTTDFTVDINTVYGTEVQGTDGTNPLVVPIAPEQQLNLCNVRVEKSSFNLMSQFSSNPIDYTQTGIDATVEISLADIDLYKLATAFNYQKDMVIEPFDNITAGNIERLQMTDQASSVLQKFDLLIIPAPGLWTADASPKDRIEWRKSWIYIPQACIS